MKPLHLFLFITLHCISFSAFAADGVDNSYVDNGANELDIFVNNNSRAVMFGPGVHTAFGPPYFIVINNNAPAYDLGTVTQLSFTFCSSKMLSAYLDRVGSARFYYRIYLESQQGNPPPYSFVNLSSNNNLDPNTCFTSRQNSTWEAPLSVNVLNGLGSGAYLIEFYMEAQLDDVGDESMGCPVNAPAQCNNPDPHYGRVLRSRFNTTDPNACNYSTILNGQAPATRIKFYTGVQPPPMVLNSSATNVNCFGGTNGTASVAVSGGTSPYNYLWNNGQNTANISGLAAGNYTVTVTDAGNSTATATSTVTQPTALLVSTSATNVNCFGGTNGTATATPTGGTAPYTYFWSNGQTTATINGLASGTYTVTVTDAKSCTKTSAATVTQPTAFLVSTSATNVNCFGGTNGTATATPTGGTAPYSYLWSNGETTGIISGLSAATYTVTVTDAKDCTAIEDITLTEPAMALSLEISSTPESCTIGSDGSATVTASGGTGPYGYIWSNGQTAQSATDLTAEDYTVTVTDANMCTSTATATVILGAVEDMKVHTWVKVFLQGPYVSAAGLMQDSLRAKGLIPLTEPYSGISGFTHVGGGGETMDQGVLDVTGPDAVVDWVFLELRTANMPSQVVATRSALLQRDGDVVDTDGQSPVVFDKEAGTAYYIAVRHRNHLGVQVGDPVLYPVCEVVETNFTELAEEDSYSYSGTNDAQRFAGNKHQMWAGNGRVDFQLKYNGSVNDRNAILNIVGINTPSNIVSGYLLADYNMDGQVKYNGAANDRNVLLGNVGIGTPSNVLNDQMAR